MTPPENQKIKKIQWIVLCCCNGKFCQYSKCKTACIEQCPPQSAILDDKKLWADISDLTKSTGKLVQEVGKLKAQPPPPLQQPPYPLMGGGNYFSSAYYYHDDPFGNHTTEDYYDNYGEQEDIQHVEHDLKVGSSADSNVNNIMNDGTGDDNASKKQDKETENDGIISKFDKFLDDLNVNDTEEYGLNMEPGLAKGVNKMFAKGMDTIQFKQMSEKIKRPGNCEAITPVKVDTIVWNLLK